MAEIVNHIFDLPPELVQAILEHVVIANGLTEAVRLRLVCKRFDDEIAAAISNTQALSAEQSVPISHISRKFMVTYIHRRVLADGKAKQNVARRLHLILEDLLSHERWPEDMYRDILKSLVTAVILQHGNEGTLELLTSSCALESDTFGTDRLHAAALLGIPRLFDAIELDDQDTRERLLEDESQTAAFTDSPLVLAAMGGQTNLVRRLLKARRSRHIESMDSPTPDFQMELYNKTERFKAIWCAILGSHDATLRVLLDPTYGGYSNDDDFGLLNALSGTDLAVLPTLCKFYGIGYGRSEILRLGIEEGRVEVVEEAIRHGADVDSALVTHARMPQTPLGLAAYHGRADIVRLLLDHKARHGLEPLQFAAKMGHAGIVRVLLAAGAFWSRLPRESPLFYAARNGQAAVVEMLLDAGVLVSGGQEDVGAAALCEAACRGFETVVRILVMRGVERDGVQKSCLPMLLAYEFGQPHVVRALVELGATPVVPARCIRRSEVSVGRFPKYRGSGVKPVNKRWGFT